VVLDCLHKLSDFFLTFAVFEVCFRFFFGRTSGVFTGSRLILRASNFVGTFELVVI